MKLIIDIPEDIYKDIIENGFIYDEDNEIVIDVIKNGIPLDKIRAEIDLETRVKVQHYTNTNAVIDAVLDVLEENMTEVESQERNLCDSCKTKGCIFQYGIVRSHCDFYKAESEDK